MIVVGGEALIDLVPAGGGGALPALQPVRGGGPYNTAVALGRLGAPVAFASRVSTDAFGASLMAGLGAAGVDTSLVQRGTEPTTLAVADVSPDGSAGFRFYAEGTADRLFRAPDTLPAELRALAVGTCSLVLEPGATAYETLLERVAADGLFTLLDPNVRPGLIADADAYRARFRSWLPHVALLKLSVEDAEWLAGGRPWAEALPEWLEAGPRAAVLTRGGEGLTAVTAAGLRRYDVPAPPVDVVDTIGAGDTVNAALLHWFDTHGALAPGAPAALDDAGWHAALGHAARAAAITCSRAGAEPPYAAELAEPPEPAG
ncbi:carbohydrate kinase family protein [Streptomyces sp. MAR4 CNX-425]|uniref:carbohydrate kinase family protein n=1 Tax=Streptomyces sp. MAR4 CNX-425 TaxID=3406343 RepID=UPI003B5025C1